MDVYGMAENPPMKRRYAAERLDAIRAAQAADHSSPAESQERRLRPDRDWLRWRRRIHWKHGSYYLVRGNKWTRLGRTNDEATATLRKLGPADIGVSDYFLQDMYRKARQRAKRRHQEFDLTLDDVRQMWEVGGGRCALTGVHMHDSPSGQKFHKRPLVPSLDRIDSKRGYTKDNVRLVCFAANMALGAWGDAMFGQLARGYVNAQA